MLCYLIAFSEGVRTLRGWVAMFTIRSMPPCQSLAPFIQSFRQREGRLTSQVIRPLPARPEQILEFYLADRYRVRRDPTTPFVPAPRAVIVGPQSEQCAELGLRGRLDVFTIHFQPAGCHGLFGLPMPEFLNKGIAAHDVFGSVAQVLEERLNAATEFSARVEAVEGVLERYAARGKLDGVARAARTMLVRAGAVRIRELATDCGLSERQFERRFQMAVGMQPKLYARVVRFHSALEQKSLGPRRSWTEVALEAGYYDQSHMTKEFKSLAGENPTRWLAKLGMISELWLMLDRRECRNLTSASSASVR
jgi:AraC-like DNA-binding protein